MKEYLYNELVKYQIDLKIEEIEIIEIDMKKTKEQIMEDIIRKLTIEEFELLSSILSSKVYVEERDITNVIEKIIKK